MIDACIYCGSCSDWAKEHAVPRGLGNFKGHHILPRSICQRCNARISKTEEQFLRASPEAFFRHVLGVRGRKSHQTISPFYRGSAGTRPIAIKAPLPETGLEILWEIIPGTNQLRELRQIVLRLEDGTTVPVPLPSGVNSADKLTEYLTHIGMEKTDPVFFSVSDDEWDQMVEVLKEVWPKKGASNVPHGGQQGRVRVAVNVQVTSLYFRAIAKVGFHYFLSVFAGQFSGAEPTFEPIRSFILEGQGQPEDFVIQTRGQFVYHLSKGLTTKPWGHFLAAEKQDSSLISKVQVFVGPENLPPIYFLVRLGKNPSKIIYPQSCGHFYRYYIEGPRDGYDGEVDAMTSGSSLLVP